MRKSHRHARIAWWRNVMCRAQSRPNTTRWFRLLYTLGRYDQVSGVAATSGRRRVWTLRVRIQLPTGARMSPGISSLGRNSLQVDIDRKQRSITSAHSSMLYTLSERYAEFRSISSDKILMVLFVVDAWRMCKIKLRIIILLEMKKLIKSMTYIYTSLDQIKSIVSVIWD